MIFPPFHPSPFFKGGHLQTLAGHFLRGGNSIPGGETVIVPLPDGDELSLLFYPGTSQVVTYVFHGLGGSIASGYMGLTARAALRLGHSVFLVNHRGAGQGRKLMHRGLYHSGRGEDLSAVFAYGRQRFAKKRHLGVGYSLSANAMLLLLAGQRGDCKPDGALVFNGPINLARTAELLQQGAQSSL